MAILTFLNATLRPRLFNYDVFRSLRITGKSKIIEHDRSRKIRDYSQPHGKGI